jgi:uncharacterized membrane protein
MPEHGTMRRLPLRGISGLVFTLGVVLIAVIYVPVLRWFLAIAIALGLLIALGLHFWHKHAPLPEPKDQKKVLNLEDR